MGVGFGKKCWTYPIGDCYKKKNGDEVKFPNPDPKRFKILDAVSFGDYLLVSVEYPDCTNFEGKKIMIYRGVAMAELDTLSSLDPHFQEGTRFSPIMRIIPTKEGWELGLDLCHELSRSVTEVSR